MSLHYEVFPIIAVIWKILNQLMTAIIHSKRLVLCLLLFGKQSFKWLSFFKMTNRTRLIWSQLLGFYGSIRYLVYQKHVGFVHVLLFTLAINWSSFEILRFTSSVRIHCRGFTVFIVDMAALNTKKIVRKLLNWIYRLNDLVLIVYWETLNVVIDDIWELGLTWNLLLRLLWIWE